MSNITFKIQRALVLGVQDFLDLAFAESQRIVNVDKGTLKKSGFQRKLRDGGTFGYRTPYAVDVNNGWDDGYVDVGEYTVKAHRRRVPHYATHSDLYRLGMGPRPRRKYQTVKAYRVAAHRQWRRGYRGSHYMERSVAKFLPRLAPIVGRRLRRLS